MNRDTLQAVGLGLSAVACALAAAAFFRTAQPPTLAGDKADPTADRVQELAKETAALRSDLDRLANASREVSARREPLESAHEPASLSPDLQKRLEDLEKSVADLQRRSKESASLLKPTSAESPDLAKLQRQATDPSATEQDKLAALKALRGQKLDGKNAISPDVVLAMLDIAERSQDEGARVDVYRNLHGVKDSALRDSMLRSLAGDPSAKVREKVAQDIDTFLPDATVEGALRQAADGDADAKVRAAAQKTLAEKR